MSRPIIPEPSFSVPMTPTLPHAANYTFVAGIWNHTFSRSCSENHGQRSVTVLAMGKRITTGITVTLPHQYFTLVANGPLFAGVPFTVTATVYDVYGNLKNKYTD